MTAPVVVASAANSATTSPVSIPVPSHIAGDLLILWISAVTDGNGPSGMGPWNVLEHGGVKSLGGGLFVEQILAYRVAGSNEPGSYNFSGAFDVAGGIVAIRGHGGIDSSASQNSHISPSVTASGGNSLVLRCTDVDGQLTAVPSGYTSVWNRYTGTPPFDFSTLCAYTEQASAGATGTVAWGLTSGTQESATLVIKSPLRHEVTGEIAGLGVFQSFALWSHKGRGEIAGAGNIAGLGVRITEGAGEIAGAGSIAGISQITRSLGRVSGAGAIEGAAASPNAAAGILVGVGGIYGSTLEPPPLSPLNPTNNRTAVVPLGSRGVNVTAGGREITLPALGSRTINF